MSERLSAPHGFAYLFERFPAFTQTFCIREVEALCRKGVEFPVFSIHRAGTEPQNSLPCGRPINYLPEKFDEILATDRTFRRAARKALATLRELWGGEQQKKRIYEALWLGPRLQEAGIRHVHVHFAGAAARTAFWLKRLFGVNFSVTAHANDIFCDEPPERLEQMFAAATMVVTVSEYSLQFLRENYPAHTEKFHRVYNGISLDGFSPSAFPAGPALIVGVGRYIEKKGFSVLVEACARLGDRDWRCEIIGNGPLEAELIAQVEALGLADRLVISGPRTEREIQTLLAGARMFVLPCLSASDGARDNLPTVIMEAMAAGLPTLSTPVAAVPEMVAEGETGFLVPERDAAALADRIARLIDDRELAAKLGGRALERCRDLFEISQTSSSLFQIFKRYDAIADRSNGAQTRCG